VRAYLPMLVLGLLPALPGAAVSGVVAGIDPQSDVDDGPPVQEAAAAYGPAAGASNTELNNSWGVTRIFADQAHARGINGAGITVAILDTGIDYTHPELAASYIGGYDFVFNDNDPFDDNFLSHGTHMAGIIAAKENGVGMVGVAPGAKILAVKVLDGAGFGMAEWTISGIQWAVAHGANIINMSLTGQDSPELKDACDAARRAGVLLVAAAGNGYPGGDPVEVDYPAAYDSVIAVTATDSANRHADFAAYGPKLELAAPGADIYSTVRGGYDTISGTSEAAAFVTGAAALYLQSNTQDLNNDSLVDSEDVRLLMQRTAGDLGTPGRDASFGYGLLNAGAVPEPSTAWLLIAAGTSLSGWIVARRRKR